MTKIRKLEDLQKDVAKAADLIKELGKPILDAALIVEGEIKQAISDNTIGGPGRTGALSRSYKAKIITDDSGKAEAGVFSDLEYAGIQDEGGDIHAKRKWLSIPLSGSVVGRWPRTMRGLFRIKSKRGNNLLVRKQGKGIEPMFLLKESVHIVGKEYIGKAVKSSREMIGETMFKHIDASTGWKPSK